MGSAFWQRVYCCFMQKASFVKFSVLLPTRNGGRYLGNCICSILEQDYRDFELVVSDNANSDETPDVLRGYASDPRVRLIRLDDAVSVTENWNCALQAASGDYLLMMGDDDYLLPGSLARLAEAIDRYHSPDCIVYNGYSYVAPGSIADNSSSLYGEQHFRFGPDFVREGVIDPELRHRIVRDMFRFRVGIPLNMQTTLVARRAADKIAGGMFVAPFPDHFALNSLLLLADRWVYLPERLVVVGVSPKSFGHYVYSDQQEGGLGYLGIVSDFPGRLPGDELVNGMYRWLLLLKERYPEELGTTAIDRGGYARRQVYTWLSQWRAGKLTTHSLALRFAALSLRDWLGVAATLMDAASWRRLGQLFSAVGRSRAQAIWHGLRPLDSVSDIRQFADWLADRR